MGLKSVTRWSLTIGAIAIFILFGSIRLSVARQLIVVGKNIDGDALAHISPTLPFRERAFMYEILRHVPLGHRENVIDIENDGSVHANREQLILMTLAAQHPWGIGDSRNNLASNTVNCVNAGDGCAHARYSNQGQTVSDVDVTFSCASIQLAAGDNGFVYSGGSNNIGTGLVVDAGLQIQNSAMYKPFSIQPFMVAAYNNQKTNNPVYSPRNFPFHLACDPKYAQPNVHLTYRPQGGSDKTHVMLMINTQGGSAFLEGYHQETAVLQLPTGALSPGGCDASQNCRVKRVTSLTTSNKSQPDGSFVGVTNPVSNPLPAISWTNAMKTYLDKTGNPVLPESTFYELNNPGNLGGSPPLFLCALAVPTSSANETIGLNYGANAGLGPGC